MKLCQNKTSNVCSMAQTYQATPASYSVTPQGAIALSSLKSKETWFANHEDPSL